MGDENGEPLQRGRVLTRRDHVACVVQVHVRLPACA